MELNSKTPEEIWIPCACMDGFMWETVPSEWLSAARQTNERERATVAKGINGLTRCIASLCTKRLNRSTIALMIYSLH